jgi:transcriptional regulator with XRE-family HTH domain
MSVETSEVLTPLERRALFRAAVTLHEITMAKAAEKLGVSYNHLMLVLHGDRVGSRELERKIAAFVNRPHETVFALRREN